MSQKKAHQTEHEPTVGSHQALLSKAMQAKAMLDGLEEAFNRPASSPPPGNRISL